MPFITPTDSPDMIGRAISIPNSADWFAVVSGALMELTFAYNWQQIDGMTPETAAVVAQEILFSWLDGAEVIGVQTIIAARIEPSGTAGGSTAANSWNQHALNTILVDDTELAVLDSGGLIVPPGDYVVAGWGSVEQGISPSDGYAQSAAMLYVNGELTEKIIGANTHLAGTEIQLPFCGRIVITSDMTEPEIRVKIYTSAFRSTYGLGHLLPNNGESKQFALLQMTRVVG